MPSIESANNAPRCTHIRYDDRPCTQPALRGHRFCRFHASARSAHEAFPTIEDGLSLQVGLNQVVRCVIDGSLERKTASLILYAFQIMCSNLKRINEERKLAQKTKDEDELPGPSLAETLLDRIDHLLEENPPEHVHPEDDLAAFANQKSEVGNQKWPDRSTGVPPVTPPSDAHPLSTEHSALSTVALTNNQSPTTNHALPNAKSPAPKFPIVIDKLEACSQSRSSSLPLRPAVISPASLRRIAYTAEAGTLIQSAAESPADVRLKREKGARHEPVLLDSGRNLHHLHPEFHQDPARV